MFYVPVTVEPESIHKPNTPCEVEIDFDHMFEQLGENGVFDRFSVSVVGKKPGNGKYIPVDFRVGEHFKYGLRGKVYWNIESPAMTEFRILFGTKTNPPRKHREDIPAIGVGDELMFNTPELVPLVAMTANLLSDFNGDGITDDLEINHYSDRYGWPYDGILFHPGIKEDDEGIVVRDYYRVRYIPENTDDDNLYFLHARYNWVWPVDWDKDGWMDLLYISMKQDHNDPGVMPEYKDLFQSSDYVPSIAAEDLDGDGKCDLIGVRTSPDGDFRRVSVYFYRNIGDDNKGIPELAEPVLVKTRDGKPFVSPVSAHVVSFGDVNGDDKIDIIFNNTNLDPPETYWCKNTGGSPPVFDLRRLLQGLPFDRRGYRWVRWNGNEGLMSNEKADLFIRTLKNGNPVFIPAGGLRGTYAPLVGGSQEKPEWIDWDDDGDIDLLTGEARGRIHLYENIGTREFSKFKSPEWIQANGEQIRIYRDGVFGGKHWHGAMGYPSVACIDWDMDGLFDMIVPNETNRVYWYRNIGTKGKPEFGKRRQILPDGFTDSPDRLEQTRQAALDPKRENHPYPFEQDIPFFWRTRLAIADYTGDGLDDIIALNGMKNLVLYERYRDSKGEPRLRQGKQLYYDTGEPVKRPHFFKFRNIDWNGDGMMDIVVSQNLFSSDKRSVLLLKNTGTPEMPVFERPRAFRMWDRVITYSSHGLQPSFIDWDGDGSLDFVGCNESGFFVLFRNAVLTAEKPRVSVGMPVK